MTSILGLSGLAAVLISVFTFRYFANRQFAATVRAAGHGNTRLSSRMTPLGWTVFTCPSCGAHHQLRGAHSISCEYCGYRK